MLNLRSIVFQMTVMLMHLLRVLSLQTLMAWARTSLPVPLWKHILLYFL